MFKLLTEQELADVWLDLEVYASNARDAARDKDYIALYEALDNLDYNRRILQSHEAAKAIG